jgi:hypothetical protein
MTLFDNLTTQNLAAINDYLATKSPPRVVSQNPPAGTPLIAGMTVEVHAVSFDDIPFQTLVPNAPVAIQKVPLSAIETWAQGDDLIKNVISTGTVPDNQRDAFVQKVNTGLAGKGLAGTITANDAAGIATSFKNSGFLRFQ